MIERKLDDWAIANQALARIEALALRPDPGTFEVFYTYFAGTIPQLSSDIDGVLSLRNAPAIQAEVDAIHSRVFSGGRKTDEVDEAGDRLAEALTSAISSIAEAAGQTGDAFTEIDQARRSLDPKNPKSIYAFTEKLVEATARIQSGNSALQARLQASRSEIETLRDDLRAAREHSVRDALTEVYNRRYFDEKVTSLVNNGKRQQPVSLLLVDIDHFKSFNDRLGHQIGDQVLRMVANCLQSCVSDDHTVARYGGEEFAIVLENSPLEEAAEVAERVRRTIMGRDIKKKSTGELLGRLTVSIGVATLQPIDGLETWIGRADEALYRSKRNGRNRVMCEDEDAVKDVPLRAVG
ncbi:diguanylate cyclase [Bradyrhizobium sp. USDA 4341]